MTGAAGGDLPDRKAELGQPPGVVLGLQIAGKHSDPFALVHPLERPFQQRSLARSRRTDEVHAENSVLAIALAQLLGQYLVLVQDLLFDRDAVHSSTSM